MNLYNCK